MRTIIASNITDQFQKLTINGKSVDPNKIKQLKNKSLSYDGKIYNYETIDEVKKQLNKNLYQKIKKGLNKVSDQQFFKLFLTKNNEQELKKIVYEMTQQVISNPQSLKESIDGYASSNYIFMLRGNSEQQSNETQIDFIEEIERTMDQQKQNFKTTYNNIFKAFKLNSKGKNKKDLMKEAEKQSELLEKAFETLLSEYQQILKQVENKYNQKKTDTLKQLVENIEKLIQNIESKKDEEIDKFIKKCKQTKSKYDKMNIDGEDRKVEIVKTFKGGSVVKTIGQQEYSIINNSGDTLLTGIKNLSNDNFLEYDNLKCIRVVSNGEKNLVDKDIFYILKNSFICNSSSFDQDFQEDYFIINNNGKYVIKKISDGIFGSDLFTCDSVRELKQHIEYIVSSPTTSSSSTASTVSFNMTEYLDDRNKKRYIQNKADSTTHELTIDHSQLNGVDSAKISDLYTKASQVGVTIKLANIKTIKISRKNRHLSLQQIALNTIFKNLK